jgi:hypothetical protein
MMHMSLPLQTGVDLLPSANILLLLQSLHSHAKEPIMHPESMSLEQWDPLTFLTASALQFQQAPADPCWTVIPCPSMILKTSDREDFLSGQVFSNLQK